MLEISLINSLADRVISLLKRREETRRAILEKTVAPAMVELEALHKSYVTRLLLYRKLASDEDNPLNEDHPLVKRIAEDDIYEAHIEAKLIAIAHAGESASDLVRGFCEEIGYYVYAGARPPDVEWDPRDYSSDRSSYETRAIPTVLSLMLADEKEAPAFVNRRKIIIHAIDSAMERLQAKYQRILQMYGQLRIKLSEPG